MSVIAGLQKADIQKHAIMKLLDAFGLDIDTENGRIYYPEDPDITLQINNKIICVDIGKDIRDKFVIFNPIIRQDHAQFLMQLAIYSRIMAGELDVDAATDANYVVNSSILFEDDDGNPFEVPVFECEITDKDDKVCGTGQHLEEGCATTFAVLDYLCKTNFITSTMLKELVDILNQAHAEYMRLSDMKAFHRKKEIFDKGSIFRGPEIEDDSEGFYDGPTESEEIEIPEWTEEELAVEFSDKDFEEADTDEPSWIDSDFTDQELRDLFRRVQSGKGEGIGREEFIEDGVKFEEVEDSDDNVAAQEATPLEESESVIQITEVIQRGPMQYPAQQLLASPTENFVDQEDNFAYTPQPYDYSFQPQPFIPNTNTVDNNLFDWIP
jgi:hypothetical protein